MSNGHDEPVALIAFTRAARGQITNRMVLQLCDALEAALVRAEEADKQLASMHLPRVELPPPP